MQPVNSFCESHLISSIQELFHPGNEHLGRFLFHHQEQRLTASPSELMLDAGAFSRGEQILIQIALDFWSGTGSARLHEILEKLDDENILAFIRAILRFREMDLYVTLDVEPSCFD